MAKIPKLGRVTERTFEKGRHYVSVEWINDEGYRVSGMFELFGWNQPPRAMGEKVMKILSKPPKVLYRQVPRDRKQS